MLLQIDAEGLAIWSKNATVRQPTSSLVFLEIVEDEQAKVADYWEEFVFMHYWLRAETFDHQVVNHRLVELTGY